jgi:hypothetical protein
MVGGMLIDELSFFRFVASARQLAKALEVPLVNDLGYSGGLKSVANNDHWKCHFSLRCK